MIASAAIAIHGRAVHEYNILAEKTKIVLGLGEVVRRYSDSAAGNHEQDTATMPASRQHYMQIQACSSTIALQRLQKLANIVVLAAEDLKNTRFIPDLLEIGLCGASGRLTLQAQCNRLSASLQEMRHSVGLARSFDSRDGSVNHPDISQMVFRYVAENCSACSLLSRDYPNTFGTPDELSVLLQFHALEEVKRQHMLHAKLRLSGYYDTAWWRNALSCDVRTHDQTTGSGQQAPHPNVNSAEACSCVSDCKPHQGCHQASEIESASAASNAFGVASTFLFSRVTGTGNDRLFDVHAQVDLFDSALCLLPCHAIECGVVGIHLQVQMGRQDVPVLAKPIKLQASEPSKSPRPRKPRARSRAQPLRSCRVHVTGYDESESASKTALDTSDPDCRPGHAQHSSWSRSAPSSAAAPITAIASQPKKSFEHVEWDTIHEAVHTVVGVDLPASAGTSPDNPTDHEHAHSGFTPDLDIASFAFSPVGSVASNNCEPLSIANPGECVACRLTYMNVARVRLDGCSMSLCPKTQMKQPAPISACDIVGDAAGSDSSETGTGHSVEFLPATAPIARQLQRHLRIRGHWTLRFKAGAACCTKTGTSPVIGVGASTAGAGGHMHPRPGSRAEQQAAQDRLPVQDTLYISVPVWNAVK